MFFQNLKNVIMIHTKTSGYNLGALLIVLTLISCYSLNNLNEYGRILSEYNKYYFNDSLKFSYQFPSDYVQIFGKNLIKESLKVNNINVKSKYCLAYFKTDSEPYLEHYLFHFPIISISQEKINKGNLDIINQIDSTGKYTEIDTLNYLLKSAYQLEGNIGYILIIASSEKIYFKNLINEYLDGIFYSVKVGDTYNQMRPKDPFELANEVFLNEDSTANYVLPIYKLNKYSENYTDKRQKSTFIQTIATYHSFLSNSPELDGFISQWRSSTYLKDKNNSKIDYTFTNEEAVKFLLEQCNENRVVMFNEAHFVPNHRLLVRFLLKDLYEMGFNYLALESLWEKDEQLNKRGYPVLESGFYTREPNMSNLIREAIKIGYRVVGYDDFSNNREKNQAENLFRKTIQRDSNAKIIVLAGFGHINEKLSERKNMMAAEFKIISGINPLTIDQIEFKGKRKNWLSVVDTTRLTNVKRLTTDIYVTNNITYTLLSQKDKFEKYELRLSEVVMNWLQNENEKYKGILSIYLDSEIAENKKAIPVRNLLLDEIKSPVKIDLPKGHYHFTTRDRFGTLLFEGKLTCK